MLIYVLFLFIYREIGEFMDKNLLYNSRPFGHFELKCLKKDTLGVKKLTKNRGRKNKKSWIKLACMFYIKVY